MKVAVPARDQNMEGQPHFGRASMFPLSVS